MSVRLVLLSLCCVLIPLGAHAREPDRETPVVPKGKRVLGMAVSEAEDGDFDRALAHARSVGVEAVGLSVAWDEIEAKPGVYESKWLPIANAFYGPRKIKLELVLKTLDTVRNRFPKDLKGKRYDDPVVIERFRRFLTWVLAQIDDVELSSFSLGNEVDGVLGTDPRAWAAFTRLFEAGRAHVKKTHPDLPVAVTVMYAGLTGGSKTVAKRLNRDADIVLLTYYPLEADMSIQPLSHLDEVFKTLVALYLDKPIVFGEIGCPSGTVMGSSPEHQKAFIERLFVNWDKYRKQVPHISYCWLTDTSKEALEKYKVYYGSANPNFVDYLATLGLRTHEGHGKDKPAFKALRAAAKARGFIR